MTLQIILFHLFPLPFGSNHPPYGKKLFRHTPHCLPIHSSSAQLRISRTLRITCNIRVILPTCARREIRSLGKLRRVTRPKAIETMAFMTGSCCCMFGKHLTWNKAPSLNKVILELSCLLHIYISYMYILYRHMICWWCRCKRSFTQKSWTTAPRRSSQHVMFSMATWVTWAILAFHGCFNRLTFQQTCKNFRDIPFSDTNQAIRHDCNLNTNIHKPQTGFIALL